MKRLIFVLAVFCSLNLMAQLEVKEDSFKEVPGFVNLNPDPVYQTDDNDLPYAVIKVRTENINDKQRRNLLFESNMAVGIILEYKIGEVWVYLTAKYADYLKISHPDLSSIEYTLPFDLQPKKGYEMTIVNKSPIDEIKNETTVTFRTKPNDVVVYVDGKQAKYNKIKVLNGKHSVTFTRNGKKVGETNEIIVSDENHVFDFDLREKYSVKVDSDPTNAHVYVRIDDKNQDFGLTPTTVTLPEGSYQMITTIDKNMSDTTLLIVPSSRRMINLEQKERVEFYAIENGISVPASLWIKRLDRSNYTINPSDTEGKRKSFDMKLPCGRYQIRMSTDTKSKTKNITVRKNHKSTYALKLKRAEWIWPWDIDFIDRFWGFQLGYVQRYFKVQYYEEESETFDIAWRLSGRTTSGFRAGIHFQPCLEWGLGIYTGLFFEYYYSKSPSSDETTDDNGFYDFYTSYSEKCISFPAHAYFRIPFSKDFALSIHGGIDIDYFFGAKYKDSNDVYMTYTPSYNTEFQYKHFNFAYNISTGIQYKVILVEASWSNGITNNNQMTDEGSFNPIDLALNKFNISLSLVF